MSSANVFPASINSQAATTASTETRVPASDAILWFDTSYLTTRCGRLQAAAMVIDSIAFFSASVASCGTCRAVSLLQVTALTAFWISFTLLMLNLSHAVEVIDRVNLFLVEFIFATLWCVFFAVSSFAISHTGPVYTASLFGLIASAIYGYDAYCKYHTYKLSESTATPSTTSDITGANSQCIP